METKHKITLEIPDEIFEEINEFKKRVNIPDDNSAVLKLIEYALSLPEYFRNFNWEKAEREADEDIATGRIKDFSSIDDFLAELNA